MYFFPSWSTYLPLSLLPMGTIKSSTRLRLTLAQPEQFLRMLNSLSGKQHVKHGYRRCDFGTQPLRSPNSCPSTHSLETLKSAEISSVPTLLPPSISIHILLQDIDLFPQHHGTVGQESVGDVLGYHVDVEVDGGGHPFKPHFEKLI